MALLLANCPSTMISAALNRSCKMPDAINGRENRSRLPISGPLHISISNEWRMVRIAPLSLRRSGDSGVEKFLCRVWILRILRGSDFPRL